MATRRKKLGRPRQIGPGSATQMNIHASAPEVRTIQRAAQRVGMSISSYVRSIVLPVALNALADEAAKWNAIDRIHQQTKVAEQTFDVS